MTVTTIIIGLTVAISLYAFSRQDVMSKLILNPYIVNNRNEYYRFITSGFIHRDHMHLIFNMISFYFFGRVIEQVFSAIFGPVGVVYFVLLYVLAIIVSDIPSYFKYRHHPAYSSLGASGGVSAIVFAFILFMPTEKIYLYFALGIPGFILGALYILYSYYQGRRGGDNINHDAHLYGALFGVVYCIVLYPQSLTYFIQQIREWRMFD